MNPSPKAMKQMEQKVRSIVALLLVCGFGRVLVCTNFCNIIFICCTCKKLLCQTCSFKIDNSWKENEAYCLSCFPEEFTNDEVEIANVLQNLYTQEEMTGLCLVGMKVRNTEDLQDIIDIHEAVIRNNTSLYSKEKIQANMGISDQATTFLKRLKVVSACHLHNGGL